MNKQTIIRKVVGMVLLIPTTAFFAVVGWILLYESLCDQNVRPVAIMAIAITIFIIGHKLYYKQ